MASAMMACRLMVTPETYRFHRFMGETVGSTRTRRFEKNTVVPDCTVSLVGAQDGRRSPRI